MGHGAARQERGGAGQSRAVVWMPLTPPACADPTPLLQARWTAATQPWSSSRRWMWRSWQLPMAVRGQQTAATTAWCCTLETSRE